MNNLITTTALSLTLIVASTSVFAAAHAVDPATVTCAEFVGMDIAAQDALLVEVASVSEGVEADMIKPSDILVQCNGMDDMTVVSVIEDMDAE